mmetsp:Transcript_11219/g.17128  ORF Transcript_11219/g.17128 Transcript_11219/m.17128 type:complete len:119 (+) Transcript_11219:635-991(+)
MLQAANCESTNDNYDNNSINNFISDRRLRYCNDFREVGIDSKAVEWLANVVFTRRTIIIPSAAAYDSSALHEFSLARCSLRLSPSHCDHHDCFDIQEETSEQNMVGRGSKSSGCGRGN